MFEALGDLIDLDATDDQIKEYKEYIEELEAAIQRLNMEWLHGKIILAKAAQTQGTE